MTLRVSFKKNFLQDFLSPRLVLQELVWHHIDPPPAPPTPPHLLYHHSNIEQDTVVSVWSQNRCSSNHLHQNTLFFSETNKNKILINLALICNILDSAHFTFIFSWRGWGCKHPPSQLNQTQRCRWRGVCSCSYLGDVSYCPSDSDLSWILTSLSVQYICYTAVGANFWTGPLTVTGGGKQKLNF